MTNDQIREIFLEHGFTIKEGQTDLKPYVYAAARALIEHDRAQRAAPAEVLTDARIEAEFKKAGGRWCGSLWVMEDADLHPFVRAIAAIAGSPRVAGAEPVAADRAALLQEVGRQMVDMTTSVRSMDEWLCIPALWRKCMEDRDVALEKLAAPADRAELATDLRHLASACIWDACEHAKDPSNPAKGQARKDSVAALFDAIDRVAAAPRPSDDELWDQTLTERDGYHDWADTLAYSIASHLGIDIGEHSSTNNPWAAAFDAITEAPPARTAGDAQGEREAFEECARGCMDPATADEQFAREHEDYKNYPVMLAWHAWQARAALAAEPWPLEEQPDGTILPVDPVDRFAAVRDKRMCEREVRERMVRTIQKGARLMHDEDQEECICLRPANFNVLVNAALAAQPAAEPEQSEDAARLDWLARAGEVVICMLHDAQRDGECSVTHDIGPTSFGDTLREAIDAARAKEGGA